MSDGTKRCSDCRAIKPHSEFYRHSGKSDGRQASCIECQKSRGKIQTALNKERNLSRDVQGDGSKECTKCCVTKPLSEFGIVLSKGDGLSSQCKDCHNARSADWYVNNREKAKSMIADWYSKNRERKLATSAAYRAANVDSRREYNAKHRAENPMLYRGYKAKRRALQLAATTYDFSHDLITARWEYYGNKCWICREEATATDHVKPLSKGGAHMPCNLRPICLPCNSSKGAIWPSPLVGIGFDDPAAAVA